MKQGLRWSSVRVRLTLWNVAVLALVLAGFSAALLTTVRVRMQTGMDRELADRAHMFVARWARQDPFAPQPRAAGRPDWVPGAPGPGPEGQEPGSPRPDEGVPPEERGPAPGQGGGLPPFPPDRRGYFQRPRVLNPDGGPLNPGGPDEPWDLKTCLRAARGEEHYSTVEVEGERVRVFSAPLRREGAVRGVVQVARPLGEQERFHEGLLRTLLMLIPLALLVAGAGGAFLTDRALRPVRQVSQAAAQISAEDLSRRLEVRGEDELSELAETFNDMLARLDRAFRQLEAAFEQQRRFTGDASHELRTPLTVIKANTSLALSGERTPEEYREALQAADQAANTMNRIVQDLLLLTRSDSGRLGLEWQPLLLDSVLRQAASQVRVPGGPAVRLLLPEAPLAVFGDTHYLVRLFVNLLENAARHTPPEGRITVSAELAGDTVVASVEDTGEGIPPEHLPHVCERFYRVDSARTHAGHGRGGGTGLGLAICQSIVRAHGGTLRIESEVGRGTRVTVLLPRAEGPALPHGESAVAPALGSGGA